MRLLLSKGYQLGNSLNICPTTEMVGFRGFRILLSFHMRQLMFRIGNDDQEHIIDFHLKYKVDSFEHSEASLLL